MVSGDSVLVEKLLPGLPRMKPEGVSVAVAFAETYPVALTRI